MLIASHDLGTINKMNKKVIVLQGGCLLPETDQAGRNETAAQQK